MGRMGLNVDIASGYGVQLICSSRTCQIPMYRRWEDGPLMLLNAI